MFSAIFQKFTPDTAVIDLFFGDLTLLNLVDYH